MTPTPTKLIWHSPESGRFYSYAPDGYPTVVLEVPRATPKVEACPVCIAGKTPKGKCLACNGKGTVISTARKPHFGDCKKHGWYPSATTYLSSVPTPKGIIDWKLRIVAGTSYKLRPDKDESEAQYVYRTLSEAQKVMDEPSESGTEWHEVLGRFLMDGVIPESPTEQRACDEVCRIINEWGVSNPEYMRNETPAINPPIGVGITIDFVAYNPKTNTLYIADFKTVVSAKYKKPKDGWAEQIALYSRVIADPATVIRNMPTDWRTAKRVHRQIIVGRDNGQVLVHEWDSRTLDDAWVRALSLIRNHRVQNNYAPPGAKPIELPPEELLLEEMAANERTKK